MSGIGGPRRADDLDQGIRQMGLHRFSFHAELVANLLVGHSRHSVQQEDASRIGWKSQDRSHKGALLIRLRRAA